MKTYKIVRFLSEKNIHQYENEKDIQLGTQLNLAV